MARLRFLQITVFLAIFSALIEAETQTINSRKLDETPPLENKCGNCPCDNPCNPPAMSPPPPYPPPPSPPPPSTPKNPPASSNCPPPPSQPSPSGDKPPNTPYIYFNGPPGNVYSVHPYYSGGPRTFSMGIIPFLITGTVWVLAF
ncbi:hypothetical protein ACS0TY_034312 [Phlomoides rotata]